MNNRTTDYQKFERSSDDNRRLLREEELILEVTEALARTLESAGVSRAELARRLGRSRGFVTQLFSGGRNLTLRTIADVLDVLDKRMSVSVCDHAAWLDTALERQPPSVFVWKAERSQLHVVRPPIVEPTVRQDELTGAA